VKNIKKHESRLKSEQKKFVREKFCENNKILFKKILEMIVFFQKKIN